MAVLSTVLCLIIGYPFSYFISKFKVKTRNMMILLVVIPMWMNFLLRTYSWISILSKNGLLNSILNFFGLPTVNLMYSNVSILIGMVYNFLPFMILPIYTTLIKIDKEYIEASHDLGANRVKTFTKLVFPMSLPGVITGITMVFIPAISTFEISALLGGNKENLIGNIIEQQFRVTGNWNFGSAMSMVLLVMILVSLFIMNKFDPEYSKRWKMENKLKKLYISLVFIFIYAPIFVLILYSFNDSKLRGSFTGITFKWYVELFNDKEVLRALYYTILIAVLTTVIATFIGTVAAIGIYYMKKSEKFVVLNLNYIPVLNPDIVIAISLMVLYKVFNIDYGFLTLLASHIVLATPYVILSVYPKMKHMNKFLPEAAMDLGATPFYALRKVILPEIKQGVFAGALLAFTLSLDDFVIAYFNSGNGVVNLSTQIYSMARKGINPSINALSTLMFIAMLVLLLIINKKSEDGILYD